MIPFRKTVLAAVAGGALCMVAIPAFAADQPSNAELMKLLQQQAAQIAELQKRLAVMESAKPSGAAPADAAAAQAAQSNAQVEAAISDSRQSQIDDLQAQVSALANGGASGGGGNIRWKDGVPEFRSSDGFFTFEPTARIGLDYSATRGSSYSARNINGTEAEALRLGASGSIGSLGYKLDVDFVDAIASVKDAYLSWDTKLFNLPTQVYIGNHLKDRSIEGSGTESDLPFMERNAVASLGAGVNGYYGLGGGVRIYGSNWHLGGSITGDDLDSDTNNPGTASDSVMYSVRGTFNPVKGANGFIHMGAWYYYETLGSDVATINNTPRIAQHFNDNLRVSASSISNPTRDAAYGYELGGAYRSFWTFGEYTKRTIDTVTRDVSNRKGTSWSAGWLLTGEKPGFSTRSGTWGTTKVLRPVTSGGVGAFEIAVRLDRYDFRNLPNGGTGNSTTIGLNWYLNDWARVMLDYVNWNTNNKVGSFKGPDDGNSFGLRALLAF